MRRVFLLLAFVLTGLPGFAQSPADSLRQAKLSEKLDQYVGALVGQPLATHAEECDFLISACKQDDDRRFVTMHLYQHYLDAKWMGAENVALHIADNWILNKKVEIDDVNYYSVFAFAEFNRASLVGAQAQPLTLKDRDGNTVELVFGKECSCPHPCKQDSGQYTVLYFYSPTCATCRVNTPGLVRVLKPYQDRVVCYAITVNSEREKWDAYLESHPEFAGLAVQLWDPDAESDFPIRYGVLQTPQLLLITPEGRILGRRLDPAALQELLQQVFERDI